MHMHFDAAHHSASMTQVTFCVIHCACAMAIPYCMAYRPTDHDAPLSTGMGTLAASVHPVQVQREWGGASSPASKAPSRARLSRNAVINEEQSQRIKG